MITYLYNKENSFLNVHFHPFDFLVQELHAINLGDSGFVVIRNGRTVFRSTFQQHNFNLTYQLESGNGADLPSAGEVSSRTNVLTSCWQDIKILY